MMQGLLDQTTVQIYWSNLRECDQEMKRLIDAAERYRYASFPHPADADRFLLSASLVRCIAGGYCSRPPRQILVDRRCARCGAPHGKPRILGSQLQLSVSHSADWVGVACHIGAEVGLDVEHAHQRDLDQLVEHVLAPQERELFLRLEPADRPWGFLRFWTRKEAVVKATGDGLGVDPKNVVVSGPKQPPTLLSREFKPMRLYDLSAQPGHVAALAVRRAAHLNVEERAGLEVLAGA
ncbi:MAG: 4'-phosphopantetheinyl transferase superfamily protein [Dehalococcoidia bacterium]|nr:4'-phosphopantetheinyl transferase superfamily protein [Dehalococcoidia bacterium]